MWIKEMENICVQKRQMKRAKMHAWVMHTCLRHAEAHSQRTCSLHTYPHTNMHVYTRCVYTHTYTQWTYRHTHAWIRHTHTPLHSPQDWSMKAVCPYLAPFLSLSDAQAGYPPFKEIQKSRCFRLAILCVYNSVNIIIKVYTNSKM